MRSLLLTYGTSSPKNEEAEGSVLLRFRRSAIGSQRETFLSVLESDTEPQTAPDAASSREWTSGCPPADMSAKGERRLTKCFERWRRLQRRRYEGGPFIVVLAFNEAAATGRSAAIERWRARAAAAWRNRRHGEAANKEGDWLMRQMFHGATGQPDPGADARV